MAYNRIECLSIEQNGYREKRIAIDLLQSINQSFISGLLQCILLPDHSWQINEINQLSMVMG